MISSQGIGGFPGVPRTLPGTDPRPTARLAMANGRSCLRTILRTLAVSELWVPHYLCPVLEPVLGASGAAVSRYPIDRQLRPVLPDLRADAAVLVVNYFGILGEEVDALAARFGSRLVVDDAQAYFHVPHASAWGFDSPRKFFGVPDGGFLFAPQAMADDVEWEEPSTRYLWLRMRSDAGAHAEFRRVERARRATDRTMSLASQLLLRTIDRAAAAAARRENWHALHAVLGDRNALTPRLSDRDVPLCYPFLPAMGVDRERLRAERVWVPRFWEGLAGLPEWERSLCDRLLPLPLDERYGQSDVRDMGRIVAGLCGRSA